MKHSHIVLIVLVLLTACKNTITEQRYPQFILIQQTQGPDLGYNPLSGVSILYQDDYAFKDLNQNGELDIYEDWRETPSKRA